MKDIEKIITNLRAWDEEDEENRAIVLVAVQKTEDKEDSYCLRQHTVIQGSMGFLVDAFQKVLNDPENGFYKVLMHALRREVTDGLLKKSDKKAENSSEEGKEADHE